MLRCNPAELSPGEFCLVTADEQTAGRGQRGTLWESTKGQNLTFNIGWRPDAEAHWPVANEQFLISEITALAVVRALSHLLPPTPPSGSADLGERASATEGADLAIKWPNDIYVGDRKICGMLLEHQLSSKRIGTSIAGIGINVNQDFFVTAEGKTEGRGAPISLRQIVGHEVEREAVLESFVGHFMEGVRLLQEGRYAEVEEAFTTLLYRRTGLHRYRDAEGEFVGEFVGIARNGLLTLRKLDTSLPFESLSRNSAQEKLCSGQVLCSYAFKEVAYVI